MTIAEAEAVQADRLFAPRFVWVKLAATIYVLAIPLSHATLPQSWVWPIALVFLLLMLIPYPIAAHAQGDGIAQEWTVALTLAALGITGLWVTPWLIIAAIVAHGLWDLTKHLGFGSAFFGWYLTGCAIVDWTYAAALATYLLTIGP